MDEATRAFFRREQAEPENQACIDLGTVNPQWASISHGCYISLEASGVHRSLGVHISFVRSTTMDSWKPQQLRLMELGGNARLKAFFRKHGVPDDLPIAQKYNTRAAEWYRRNLRALSEGSDPPPPLEEGTGHLPVNDVPSKTQMAFAQQAASRGLASPGGAYSSDAHHYSTSPGVGAGGSSPVSGGMADSRNGVRRMEGFGSDGPSAAGYPGQDSDVFSGFLGPNVGTKVSTGVWSTVGLVGSFASKARNFADAKITQAQSEGWLDAALDTAKQSVDAATEVAKRSVEAGRATYTYVNEGGGKAALERTSEVLGSTARTSMSAVEFGADWLVDQLGVGPSDSSSGLQSMSSGTMQGFGSDGLPPLPPQASPQASSSSPSAGLEWRRPKGDGCCLGDGEGKKVASPVAARRSTSGSQAAIGSGSPEAGAEAPQSFERGGGAGAGATGEGAASSSAESAEGLGSSSASAPSTAVGARPRGSRDVSIAAAPPPPSGKAAALWNDDDWGDWH